jgi:hypothetical protein
MISSVDQDSPVNWDDQDPFDVAGVIKVREEEKGEGGEKGGGRRERGE